MLDTNNATRYNEIALAMRRSFKHTSTMSWTRTIFNGIRGKMRDEDYSTRTDTVNPFDGRLLVRDNFAQGPVDWTVEVEYNRGEVTVTVFDGSPEDVKHYEDVGEGERPYEHGRVVFEGTEMVPDDVTATKVAYAVHGIIEGSRAA